MPPAIMPLESVVRTQPADRGCRCSRHAPLNKCNCMLGAAGTGLLGTFITSFTVFQMISTHNKDNMEPVKVK